MRVHRRCTSLIAHVPTNPPTAPAAIPGYRASSDARHSPRPNGRSRKLFPCDRSENVWSVLCVCRQACFCDESPHHGGSALHVEGGCAAEARGKRCHSSIIGKPEQLSPTPSQVQGLKAPARFSVSVFAEGLGKPRILEVADDGSVRDSPRTGQRTGAARHGRRRARRSYPQCGTAAHAARHRDRWTTRLPVSVKDVFTADINSDGIFENITRIVDDLPEGGQHANRTIRIGPDKQLYVSVGSTCNACDETSPGKRDASPHLARWQIATDLCIRPAKHDCIRLASRHQRAVRDGPRNRLARRRRSTGGAESSAARQAIRMAVHFMRTAS